MTVQTDIAALKQQINVLLALVAKLEAGLVLSSYPSTVPAPAPSSNPPAVLAADDVVYVSPLGVNAKGAVHKWPTPHPEIAPAYENCFGYAYRCAHTIDPATGQPYFPVALLGTLPLGVPAGLHFAEQLDKFLYPELWWDAAEVQRQADLQKNAGDFNQTMLNIGQQTAAVVNTAVSPAETEVVISNEQGG